MSSLLPRRTSSSSALPQSHCLQAKQHGRSHHLLQHLFFYSRWDSCRTARLTLCSTCSYLLAPSLALLPVTSPFSFGHSSALCTRFTSQCHLQTWKTYGKQNGTIKYYILTCLPILMRVWLRIKHMWLQFPWFTWGMEVGGRKTCYRGLRKTKGSWYV